jgi:adenosylcobinamide kinase/adenosylcobinamide-phosphate guanylyltransferase
MNEILELKNLTFILGGARSGKSTLAEHLAGETAGQVLYVATAEIRDEEMRSRIEMHQQRRPANWDTLEAPLEVAARLREVLPTVKPVTVLLDCLSLLTSNFLLTLPEGKDEIYYWEQMQQEIIPLIETVASYPEIAFIFVSNEVGAGIVPAYSLGRVFRDVLGRVNQAVAAAAGTVYYTVAGLPMKIKS